MLEVVIAIILIPLAIASVAITGAIIAGVVKAVKDKNL
jgi:hypothetical protein